MKENEFEQFLDNLSLPILLAKVSFALLLLSMLLYWFQASFKYNRENENKDTFLTKAPSVGMGLANIALALLLSIRWIESGHFPLSNLYESLLFLSWSLTTIHFFLEKAFSKGELLSPTLGAITAPLSLFTNAFATFSLPKEMQTVTVLVPALKSNWLIMHVSVMMVSYAALLSGSLLAMAFLVVNFYENKLYLSEKKTCAAHESENFKQGCNSYNGLKQIRENENSHAFSMSAIAHSTKEKHMGSMKTQNNVILDAALMKFTYIVEEIRNKFNVLLPTNSNKFIDYAFKQSEMSYVVNNNYVEKTVDIYVGNTKGYTLEDHNEHISGSAIQLVQGTKRIDQVTTDFSAKKQNYSKLKNTLDNLSYRSIGLGFALLTIGIFSGAVWANEAWGSYWSWDPKETWAFVTWLVFALYLHTRLSRGWIGKESAFVATFGFLVIWFCYLGVNLFGKGLHSYGWFPVK